MGCLVLVPASRRQVVQAPWHVFLLGKNHDKTDFVYRMLDPVLYSASRSLSSSGMSILAVFQTILKSTSI